MDDPSNKRLRQEVEKLLQIAIERLSLVISERFRKENAGILQQIQQKMIETEWIKTSKLSTIKSIINMGLEKTLKVWLKENNINDKLSDPEWAIAFQKFLDWDSTGYAPPRNHFIPSVNQFAVDTQERLALKYPRRKTETQESCGLSDLTHSVAQTSGSALFKRRHEIYPHPPQQATTYGEHRRMKAATDVKIAETDPMPVQSVCMESNVSESPPNVNNNNNIVVDNRQTDQQSSRNGVRVLTETTKISTHRKSVSECSTKHCGKHGDTDEQVTENVEQSKPTQSVRLNHKNKENHRELQDLLSYTTEILPKLGRRKSVSSEEEHNMQLLKQFGINQTVEIVLQHTDSSQIAHRTRSKSIDSTKYLKNPEPAKQTLPMHSKISQRRESKSMEVKKQTTATTTTSKAVKRTARKSVSKPQNNVQSINSSNHRIANKNVINNVPTQKEHKVTKPNTASAKRTRRSPSPHRSKRSRSRTNVPNDLLELENDVGKDSDEDKPPELLPNAVLHRNPQPNNNSEVHCHSDYMERCCLCSYNGELMVRHYVYNHPKKAVYVSRVAPDRAQLIRADPFGISGRKAISRYGNQEIIVFRCHFCDLRLSESQELWLDHISKHTGEYRYKCMLCPTFARMPIDRVTHHSVCTNPSMQLWHTYTFEENHLYAYMCNKCNFVQVLFVNMRRHFQEDHPEASSIEIGYTKFSLVNFHLQDEEAELPYRRIKIEPSWDDEAAYVSIQKNIKQELELTLPENDQTNSRVPLQFMEQEQSLLQPEAIYIKQEIPTCIEQYETTPSDSIVEKACEVSTTSSTNEPQERNRCMSSSCLRVKKLPGDTLSTIENNASVKLSKNSSPVGNSCSLKEYSSQLKHSTSNAGFTDTTSSTGVIHGKSGAQQWKKYC